MRPQNETEIERMQHWGEGDLKKMHKGANFGLRNFLLHLLVALSLEENSVVQLFLHLALRPFLLLAPAARLCNRHKSKIALQKGRSASKKTSNIAHCELLETT